MPQLGKCKQCGASMSGRSHKMFCSDKCRGAYHKRKKCMVCASAIPEENITSLKYCSRSCQDKAYKAKHRSKVSEHTLIKKMQDLSFLNSVFLKVKEKRLGEIR